MNDKTTAFQAAVAKLPKRDISQQLAQQLARDYNVFLTSNPETTLDEYLKIMGITIDREDYVAAVGHYVSHDQSTREGMVMETCNLGSEPKRAAAH